MSKRHFDIQKVIIILGQTATGKSALAIKIAKKVNGEVISADSRQIYKGLDIGTGKISKREMKGIPHHLLDVANPKHKFSVAEFQQLAISAIAEIISRGKTPIICGGTGFYIDAITKGIVFPEVPPNYPLRKKLAFAKTLGKVPKIKVKTLPYKFMKIGLYLPPEKLKKKVGQRVKKMFKNGLLKEIKKLKKSGVSDQRLKELGFEYDYPTPEKVIKETLQYAKRQTAWFKRDKEIKWFELYI